MKLGNPLLLKIVILVSFFGVLQLLLFSLIEPSPSQISELDNLTLGSRVKIIGNLTKKVQLDENFYALTIKDNSSQIGVVLDKNFTSNKTLEITGILEEYKDKKQIKADKIIERW